MDKGFRKAITKYRQAAKLATESVGQAEDGPFLVATGISADAYEQWSAVQEKKWQLFWNRTTREVWLYGDPSRLHETAASYFTAMLGHKLEGDAISRVSVEGSPALTIPAGGKEPDFAFGPLSQDKPTIVGEVAYHNESFNRLIEEKEMWRNAEYIQYFIGLKVTVMTQAQKTDPTMTLITWRRDTNKSEVINFGSHSDCDKKSEVFLELPVNCLFHQEQIPYSLAQQTSIKFDLYDLRQRCRKKLELEHQIHHVQT